MKEADQKRISELESKLEILNHEYEELVDMRNIADCVFADCTKILESDLVKKHKNYAEVIKKLVSAAHDVVSEIMEDTSDTFYFIEKVETSLWDLQCKAEEELAKDSLAW